MRKYDGKRRRKAFQSGVRNCVIVEPPHSTLYCKRRRFIDFLCIFIPFSLLLRGMMLKATRKQRGHVDEKKSHRRAFSSRTFHEFSPPLVIFSRISFLLEPNGMEIYSLRCQTVDMLIETSLVQPSCGCLG